jgi:hypothetical protein
VPAPGSEIARVTTVARQLVKDPDLRGLTPRQRAQIVNWTPCPTPAPSRSRVVEKTVSELQDAMTRGVMTSEDVVRDYLTRLTLYDRNGPTFRSVLSSTRAPWPMRARATPSARRAACAARSTACPSSSRTTSTPRSCPPRGARARSPIIARASTRAWRRA